MLEFLYQGGSAMWLMMIMVIVILFTTTKTIISHIQDKNNEQIKSNLNSILFWGGISAGLGVFGHFTGIFIAMQDVLKASDTSPAIVAKGYMMSIVDIIIGLTIFIFAFLIWFVLHWRYQKMLINQKLT